MKDGIAEEGALLLDVLLPSFLLRLLLLVLLLLLLLFPGVLGLASCAGNAAGEGGVLATSIEFMEVCVGVGGDDDKATLPKSSMRVSDACLSERRR